MARHWLLITGIYSLLEQALKFLRSLQDPAYDLQAMHNDGHNFYDVYQRLPDECKQDLRLFVDEYASFVGITDLARDGSAPVGDIGV